MKWIVLMALLGGITNQNAKCVREFASKTAAESWLNAQALSGETSGCDIGSAVVYESKALVAKWKKKKEKVEFEVLEGVTIE